MWGSTFPSHLSSLIVLHKRAIRLISNSTFLAHTNELFYDHGILKLKEINQFRLILYVYKNFDKFSTFNTITRGSTNLRPDFQRLRLCQNSVNYLGTKCWNALPAELKSIDSFLHFRNSVKQYLLSRYSPEIWFELTNRFIRYVCWCIFFFCFILCLTFKLKYIFV